MSDDSYICVIGAAIVDIVGYPKDRLIQGDSIPGHIHISMGGVGRNIAENLGRLGQSVELLTALGKDHYGVELSKSCTDVGVGISHSLISPNSPSATNIALIDRAGDMHMAIAEVDIFEEMITDFLEVQWPIISGAKVVVLETNIPHDLVTKILTADLKATIFVDAVSVPFAKKVLGVLGHIDVLKCNQLEAEVLCGKSIESEKDAYIAGEKIRDEGVNTVLLTLGQKGVLLCDERGSKIFRPEKVRAINAIGAGDAFSAGFIYGLSRFDDTSKAVKIGMQCAEITVQDKNTVSTNISPDLIVNI